MMTARHDWPRVPCRASKMAWSWSAGKLAQTCRHARPADGHDEASAALMGGFQHAMKISAIADSLRRRVYDTLLRR